MSEEGRSRGLLITPAQWFVGTIAIAVGISLVVALIRAPQGPDRLYDWAYPEASSVLGWGIAGPPTAISVTTSAAFTNVSSYYRKRIHLPLVGTGPLFTYHIRGIFPSSRRLQKN